MATQSSLSTKSMELLVAYAHQPSVAVRNQLVRLNAGLVRKVAHRISRQSAESYEDLEQIGYLGLIRAIERFDPSHGCAFSSFAVPYIRGEMLHFLRDRSSTVKIPRRWQDLHKAGQQARHALALELGRPAQDHEIAERLGISASEWQSVKLSSSNRSLLSLDATVSHTDDCKMTMGDLLPDHQVQLLQQQEEDRAQLQHALSQLEEKTRMAVEQVYLQARSRKEVAEQAGVSPMTISRRLQKGIEQLSVLLNTQSAAAEL